MFRLVRTLIGCVALIVIAAATHASTMAPPDPALVIPKLTEAPKLEDFESMHPSDRIREQMVRVDGFVQRDPSDGSSASQRTEVYLGFDDKNVYVVFLAFDSEPGKIRARLSRREDIWSDDTVEIWLDTFQDQRRAYRFACNPLGVQWDGTYVEGDGWDQSFDAVWYSKAKLTSEGYVAWMAIPFRSLRFRPTDQQEWGFILGRNIVRSDERTFLPYISARTSTYLTQAARLRGLRDISSGRNMQFMPYASFRSSRSMDLREAVDGAYRFNNQRFAASGGVDAKIILKDSLVLDATINPDFSQVESDEPQVTVNNRFELWFPERRPFFLENASYFDTPLSLVFTRRIADPNYGLRLSGKTGPYSLGFLFADDDSPGKTVSENDPAAGSSAHFGVARVSRDIGKGSNVGVIFTDREYGDEYNRVGGVDTRLRFNSNWSASAQAVQSATKYVDSEASAGPAYDFNFGHSGRKFRLGTEYRYISPEFVSQPGFVTRTDIGRFEQNVSYRFRPEGRHVIDFGPSFSYSHASDHDGVTLEKRYSSSLGVNFRGHSWLSTYFNRTLETLRPVDFETLDENRAYQRQSAGINGQFGLFEKASASASYSRDRRITYVTPEGVAPYLASGESANFNVSLRPLSELKIDNGYSFSRTRQQEGGAALFNTQIVRSRWNFQVSRELSLRVIGQYNSVSANPYLTSLQPTRALNFDFLLSYLLHPGTALYLGYNSDLQNIDPALRTNADGALLRGRNYINDGRQVFLKLSYLLRF